MSYSKKILLLYRSCDSRVEAIDEEIRAICVRSFGFKNSVERIFDRVCGKACEKEDLLWFRKRVDAVLKRLGKDNREILLYRYLNVLPKGGEEKRFSRSGYYRKLALAEAVFEEYLGYVGLSQADFEREYKKYSWAKNYSDYRFGTDKPKESLRRINEIETNPFLLKKRGRPKKIRVSVPEKTAANAKGTGERVPVGIIATNGAACASAALKPVVIRIFPTRLA